MLKSLRKKKSQLGITTQLEELHVEEPKTLEGAEELGNKENKTKKSRLRKRFSDGELDAVISNSEQEEGKNRILEMISEVVKLVVVETVKQIEEGRDLGPKERNQTREEG